MDSECFSCRDTEDLHSFRRGGERARPEHSDTPPDWCRCRPAAGRACGAQLGWRQAPLGMQLPRTKHWGAEWRTTCWSQVRTWEFGGSNWWTSTRPLPNSSDGLGSRRKFPGLWRMVTLPQHSNRSHLRWVTVTLYLHIFSLQKVLCRPTECSPADKGCWSFLVIPHWHKQAYASKDAFQRGLLVCSPCGAGPPSSPLLRRWTGQLDQKSDLVTTALFF